MRDNIFIFLREVVLNMKKAVLIFFISAIGISFTGCSAKNTENNISRAIDGAGRDIKNGVDKLENGMENNGYYSKRGWDNGLNTNGTATGYYSDNYDGYYSNRTGIGYYNGGYGSIYDDLGVSGTKYGDDSGFQGYYDNNTKKDNNNVRKY